MRKLALLVVVLPALSVGSIACEPSTTTITPPSQCGTLSGPGTQHATNVTTDETWTAAASPHVIPYDISIRAKVTLEPCAVVQIAKQKTVSLDQPSSMLIANGEATKPVTITALDPNAPFAKIRLFAGGTMNLTYTNIDGGGDKQNTLDYLTGTIDARGDQTKATQPILGMRHVKLSGSASSNGILLAESAGFTDASTDLVITGCAGHPIHTWARSAGTIPPGTYTGNSQDTILLSGGPAGQGYVHEDTTWHERGIPYEIGTANGALDGRIDVDGDSIPLLTIEPGVTIRFQKDYGKLLISTFGGDKPARGAIHAVGTDTKKITFTSAAAAPARGDWYGIWFAAVPDPRNILENVVVEWAGSDLGKSSGSSSCTKEPWAAIRFVGYGPATPSMLKNVKILHSSGNGIDRGWRDDSVADLTGNGNTFDDIGKCLQTTPKDHNGACPDPVPCP